MFTVSGLCALALLWRLSIRRWASSTRRVECYPALRAKPKNVSKLSRKISFCNAMMSWGERDRTSAPML
jgi:hypothetical protein